MKKHSMETIDLGKEIMRSVSEKFVWTLRELAKDTEIAPMTGPDALTFVASLLEEEIRKQL